MAMKAKRVHLTVHGRVQGVFFRAHTFDKATGLGLKGIVRNLPDGTVEVVAEGANAAVDELVEWLQDGPTLATVTHLDVSYEPPADEFSSFRIAT